MESRFFKPLKETKLLFNRREGTSFGPVHREVSNRLFERSGFHCVVMSFKTRTQYVFLGERRLDTGVDYGVRGFMGRVSPRAVHSMQTAFSLKRFNFNRK